MMVLGYLARQTQSGLGVGTHGGSPKRPLVPLPAPRRCACRRGDVQGCIRQGPRTPVSFQPSTVPTSRLSGCTEAYASPHETKGVRRRHVLFPPSTSRTFGWRLRVLELVPGAHGDRTMPCSAQETLTCRETPFSRLQWWQYNLGPGLCKLDGQIGRQPLG